MHIGNAYTDAKNLGDSEVLFSFAEYISNFGQILLQIRDKGAERYV